MDEDAAGACQAYVARGVAGFPSADGRQRRRLPASWLRGTDRGAVGNAIGCRPRRYSADLGRSCGWDRAVRTRRASADGTSRSAHAICVEVRARNDEPDLISLRSMRGLSMNENVTVRQGRLRGERSADGEVTAFRGIPFALPPLGNLRWREIGR